MKGPTSLRLARAGSVAFAVMLWISAVLKALGPNFVASTLSWTGWPFEVRVQVVDGTVLLEAVLAAALLGFGTSRLVQSLGAWTALLLMGLHALVLWRGDGGCGCFGEVAVPDAITLASLAVGFVSCAWLCFRMPDAPRRRWRSWLGAVFGFALIVGSSAWSMGGRDPMNPVTRMLTRVTMEPETEQALFVIGAFACAPCYEEVERIEALRATHPTLPQVPVYFASPITSDLPEEIGTRFPWLRHARLPEELWRRLTDSGSPAFLLYRRGQDAEVETDWRVGTVEQMAGGR